MKAGLERTLRDVHTLTSRGEQGLATSVIVGDAGGVATVASPMYKQRFDLATGCCLDADVDPLAVHEVRAVDGVVHVRVTR